MPITVSVAGRPVSPSGFETVRQYEQGELRFVGYGVWYERSDEEGNRGLYLYPVPGGAVSIELEYVFQGAPLANDSDAPDEFPEWFHPKLLHLAAETYYATVEDNPELAEIEKAKADGAIGQLVRYDNERQSGEGVFQIPVVGVSA